MRTNLYRSALGWLVWDTFRQSLASGIFWIMITITVLCTLLSASVDVTGASPLAHPGEEPMFLPRKDPDVAKPQAGKEVLVVTGELKLAFGLIRVPLGRDAIDSVRYLQLLLAGVVADTVGLLLALIWTAGFLPAFLQPNAVVVLLAKPSPRWQLLVGKSIGVLSFVLFQGVLFVGCTDLALGLKTGIWDARYFWTIPLLVLNFAAYYSFSLLLAVFTRSTVTCIFGSLLFWLICWGMSFGRHAIYDYVAGQPESHVSDLVIQLVNVCYWLLPKPYDMQYILFTALGGETHFSNLHQSASLAAAPQPLVILSSFLFPLLLTALAAQQLNDTDF